MLLTLKTANFIQNKKISLATDYEGHWIWPHSDEGLSDTFWGTNLPNNKPGNTDDCGVMVLQEDTFWWEDTSCLAPEVHNKTVAPICQWFGNCPDNWVEFSVHCYLYISDPQGWDSAEADCVRLGGHLASVHSDAENAFIDQLTGLPYTWLGASDTKLEVGMLS